MTTSAQHHGMRSQAAYPVYRWDPFRDIQQTNDRLNMMIRSLFGDSAAMSPMVMPVDVEETDDAYIVDIDLPNVKPQDVSLEMRGEELLLTGQFRQREHHGKVHRHNRPEGDFEYAVDLPSDIDGNRIDATYDSGVLTVRIGKTQQAQPRRIEIHEMKPNGRNG
jgi:HSP20 family protein